MVRKRDSRRIIHWCVAQPSTDLGLVDHDTVLVTGSSSLLMPLTGHGIREDEDYPEITRFQERFQVAVQKDRRLLSGSGYFTQREQGRCTRAQHDRPQLRARSIPAGISRSGWAAESARASSWT